MSPTSFQTAPPRDIMLYMICSLLRKYSRKRKWMEVDSNHRSNLQQIYSLSPLATRESAHFYTIWNCIKPMIGLEPITCWLQISCSANWATSAYDLWLLTQRIAVLKMTPTGFEPVLPPWKGDVLTAWPWGQVFKSSSPSRARTYNPSVNSRVLYHWAIEE